MKIRNIVPLILVFLVATTIFFSRYNISQWFKDDSTPINIPLVPKIETLKPFTLTAFSETHRYEEITVNESICSERFEHCILRVYRFDDISIADCEFVNSRIHIVECSNITFKTNIVRDYYIAEDPALLVSEVSDLHFSGNMIMNNSVGIVVSGGRDLVFSYNLFEANDQHNAIMGLNTQNCTIHNNLFRYNFPHALMIMNREENPEVYLDIYSNIFDRNIEDAINFEDYRGSTHETYVHDNIINGTGQAGLNIEYNSWGANIVVEGNHIYGNGLLALSILDQDGKPTSIFPSHKHQPEPYSEGWKHGIKLEDCSNVTIKSNYIYDNKGNGVDLVNAREITLENNTITSNINGISLRKYYASSFIRTYSPLLPNDAGYSELYSTVNIVVDNIENDYYVEEGSTLRAP
ncbi:MAG: right-handed parallel beta-helix repeat-containing protein [Candidatus Bathyarchaeota archaeon]|nr:right-handed parallel beta-helix repeat-containing protein [Candidatus Bathyarchaeota archaeon]